MQPQIILFSNNSDVIKDFEISARLAGALPLIARTTSEAKRAINSQKIALIFFQGDLLGEGGNAVTFASELDNDSQFKSLPRYLLDSQDEDPIHPQGRGCFLGAIGIPIEFPTFIETVQKLLHEHDSAVEGSISIEINIPTTSEATREKLHLIKQIQMAVLVEILKEIESIDQSALHCRLSEITNNILKSKK